MWNSTFFVHEGRSGVRLPPLVGCTCTRLIRRVFIWGACVWRHGCHGGCIDVDVAVHDTRRWGWGCCVVSFPTQGHEAPIRDMCWSHDESWLLSADITGCIRMWRKNLKMLKDFAQVEQPVNAIHWAPTDTKFVTATDDSVLLIWDFATQRKEMELKGVWQLTMCHMPHFCYCYCCCYCHMCYQIVRGRWSDGWKK